MKNKRNSREKTVEKLVFYIALASPALAIITILGYNFSNFAKPIPSSILSVAVGYLMGLALDRLRPRKNEIRYKITQAYDDILDKSFLNPGNKMKKGVREDG
jgi:hypothetical protein